MSGPAPLKSETPSAPRRQEPPENLDRLASSVVDAGLKVHRALGPGLLESAYEACLGRELDLRGIRVRRQIHLPVEYEGIRLDTAYRLDMVVADAIIIEIKAVDVLTQLHAAQLLTYLRLSRIHLGFLMNFKTILFKDGVRRIIR